MSASNIQRLIVGAQWPCSSALGSQAAVGTTLLPSTPRALWALLRAASLQLPRAQEEQVVKALQGEASALHGAPCSPASPHRSPVLPGTWSQGTGGPASASAVPSAGWPRGLVKGRLAMKWSRWAEVCTVPWELQYATADLVDVVLCHDLPLARFFRQVAACEQWQTSVRSVLQACCECCLTTETMAALCGAGRWLHVKRGSLLSEVHCRLTVSAV